MRRLGAFYRRLFALVRRRRLEHDLNDELAFHVAMREAEHREAGLTPDQAHVTARRQFGSVALLKEQARDAWAFPSLESWLQDFRFAVRTLRRSPGFTFIAVVTLALGIGANTAIFSVVRAVLLRPLPYKDSDRLVRLVDNIPAAESRNGRPMQGPVVFLEDLVTWRAQTETLSHMAAYEPTLMTLVNRESAARLTGARVSPSIFPMLGAQPLLGRVFDAGEERSGADAVAVLSYGAWQKHFHADSTIIGRTVALDDRGYSVVGVMRPAFDFPDRQIEVWTPFVVAKPEKGRVTLVRTIARLKDGVSMETATAEANLLAGQLHASWRPLQAAGPPRVQVIAAKDALVAPIKPALRVLAVAVGFVLLIACVNLANLLLARNTSRRRDTAVRRALGATRARLIRQMMTESLVLAGFGGLIGTLLASGSIRVLKTLAAVTDSVYGLAPVDPGSVPIPRLDQIRIDSAVLALTVGLSVVVGVCVGVTAAFPLSDLGQIPLIHDAPAADLRVSRRLRLRGLLVVTEISLATMLLVGAGLVMRSFVKLATVNTGYDPINVLTFQVGWPKNRYSVVQRVAFSADLAMRMRALPLITSTGFTNILPLTGGGMFLPFQIPGLPPLKDPRDGPQARIVSRDYLHAMGIHLFEGRWFGDQDEAGRRPVVLVNRALARRFYADRHPVGTVISSLGPTPWEIIGVVDDMRQSSLDTEPYPQFYIDVRQAPTTEPFLGPFGSAFFAVRTAGDPMSVASDLRAMIQQLDPQATLDGVTPMEKRVSDSIARPRLYAVLLGIFATVAVALSTIGIWGVVAYTVTQRTHEIGIRIALGALRSQVVVLVLRQNVTWIAIGLIIGLGGAAAVARSLAGMLFGLTPLDPATFVAVFVLFAFVAMGASYLPARRATNVDPLVALRCE